MADMADLASRFARSRAVEMSQGAGRQCEDGGNQRYGKEALN
jgi:hypothetical protein